MASSGFKHPFTIHESDNSMITNHGNNAIFASNQSLAYTPDSMGLKLKKGTYNMVIWLCNNREFHDCDGSVII